MFLKKRAALEEDNCSGLKKLCRLTQDSMRRPEHRTGTFSQAYDEMVYIHERMAENGSHFAASLHQMHDDLVELASTAERSRKHWKTNGLSAEQKVADLEQAMRKQKTKYDALADEYERARTGEARQTGKVLNAFKNKSAAQQEEDLLRKVQAADASYQNHVQTVLQEKQVLESTTRPEAIQSLQDLIKELDSGLALQMQKFGMLSTLCFEPLSLALASYLSTLTVSSCFQRETPVEQWLEHQPYQGARRRRQPFSKESSSCRHVYRQRKRLDIVCLVAASQGPATSRGDQVRTQPSKCHIPKGGSFGTQNLTQMSRYSMAPATRRTRTRHLFKPRSFPASRLRVKAPSLPSALLSPPPVKTLDRSHKRITGPSARVIFSHRRPPAAINHPQGSRPHRTVPAVLPAHRSWVRCRFSLALLRRVDICRPTIARLVALLAIIPGLRDLHHLRLPRRQ